MRVVERGAERIFSDSGEQVRDESRLVASVQRRKLAHVAGGSAHVAVAHEHEVVASGGQQAEEIVDFRIERAGAVMNDDTARNARITRCERARDVGGGVERIGHTEQELEARMVLHEKALEIPLEIGVGSAERLQDQKRAAACRFVRRVDSST